MRLGLNDLINNAKKIAKEDEDENSSDCDSIFLQISDASWDDDHTLQSLKTAISCLTELLPSIDRALIFLDNSPIDNQCDPLVRSYPVQIHITSDSSCFSKAEQDSVERIGGENWHRNITTRPKMGDEALNVFLEPCDAFMEVDDQPISDVGPMSTFNDSGFGASQPSCAATIASPSSVISKIEGTESRAL